MSGHPSSPRCERVKRFCVLPINNQGLAVSAKLGALVSWQSLLSPAAWRAAVSKSKWHPHRRVLCWAHTKVVCRWACQKLRNPEAVFPWNGTMFLSGGPGFTCPIWAVRLALLAGGHPSSAVHMWQHGRERKQPDLSGTGAAAWPAGTSLSKAPSRRVWTAGASNRAAKWLR